MNLHKGQLDHYKIKSNQPLLKWTFDSDTLFERLNSYLKRLHDVNEIIVAANDFLQLEKIEIGGIKGRHLGERVRCILNEFHALYTFCIANHTNLLEPSNKQFNILRRNFKSKITVLERKLSQILMKTFSNCNSVESSIKVIEMFGRLLQRPIVKEQISTQIVAVIKSMQTDISTVHSLLSDNSHDKRIKVHNSSLSLKNHGLIFCFSFLSFICLQTNQVTALLLLPPHLRLHALADHATTSSGTNYGMHPLFRKFVSLFELSYQL